MMYNIVFTGIAYLFTVVALHAQEAIAIDEHADCTTALNIKVQKMRNYFFGGKFLVVQDSSSGNFYYSSDGRQNESCIA